MTLVEKVWRTSLKAGGMLTILAGFASVTLIGCPSGGVGDPCIPEDEYRENFAGFQLQEENIESRSFQCQTRICLVNHFQGRKSCPQGQAQPEVCGINDPCQNAGDVCEPAGVIITDCDPTRCDEDGADPNNCNDGEGKNAACGGNVCDQEGRFCRCSVGQCPDNYFCQADDEAPNFGLCSTSVCMPSDETERESRCFIPGTEIPVAVEVCSQCGEGSQRSAENSVYCSCRCGPPSVGASESDDSFNFCECPEDFVCSEIRPSLGLGDPNIAGSYCIRVGSEYDDTQATSQCGEVQGHWNTQCDGNPNTGGT